ncbi:hypothetical protein [Ascidiaceihabitans sp.]|uniref:hypothetical protein n=1 Tax=Ascidiaceihabitans sp. TaxID=1872644 RepID=UPI0032983880
MMRRTLLSAAILVWSAPMAWADAQLTVALDRLRVADMIGIMRIEGADYAQALNTDFLGGQGGGLWDGQIQDIYDADRMYETVRGAFDEMSDLHLRQINLFFGSELGSEIIELELAARRAMMDETIEDMAKDAYEQALDEDPMQVNPLKDLASAGDMIDRNVTGALTANYRFYRGMVDGGAFDMTDDEMLAESWAQEADIRIETELWLMGYLMLSYRPLDEQDFQTYLAFTQTPAGRALNAAVFDGFNTMYADISYALGRAVALNMQGADL